MMCADCHPCWPEDIDPTTTVWRCDDHQRAYDAGPGALFADLVARGLIVAAPHVRPPFTFADAGVPAGQDQPMSEIYDVLIIFTDGTQERIADVTNERVHEGVLRLVGVPIWGREQPVGSWPLCNIKSWGRTS